MDSPAVRQATARAGPGGLPQRHLVHRRQHRDGLRPGRHGAHPDRAGRRPTPPSPTGAPATAPGGRRGRRPPGGRWCQVSPPRSPATSTCRPPTTSPSSRASRGSSNTRQGTAYGAFASTPSSPRHLPAGRQDRHGVHTPAQAGAQLVVRGLRPRNPTPSTWCCASSTRAATAPTPPPRSCANIFNYLVRQPGRAGELPTPATRQPWRRRPTPRRHRPTTTTTVGRRRVHRGPTVGDRLGAVPAPGRPRRLGWPWSRSGPGSSRCCGA